MYCSIVKPVMKFIVLLISETGHGKKRKADEIDPQTVDVPAKIHINRHHPRFRDYY